MMEVPAADFIREFARYSELVQYEPLAVTDENGIVGCFMPPHQFEEFMRVKAMSRRSRVVDDLTPDEIEEIAQSRMSPEHDHLDALLDQHP